MTKLTSNQRAVLLAVLTNDYGSFNGGKTPADYTFNPVDWQVWSNCIDCCGLEGAEFAALPKGKALSGTVGQLVRAGLLTSDGECVGFTKAGFELAIANDPRKA